MPMNVLNVAFPFAPVDDDPVGGAEQVVAQLDRALMSRGHRSFVIAQTGSRVAGRLLPVHCDGTPSDPLARGRTFTATRDAIEALLARERIDVIHFHGSDCDAYLPGQGPPMLLTLHMPLAWYAPQLLSIGSPRLWLQPVSANQARRAPRVLRLLPPIENGVEVEDYRPAPKLGFALTLSRICPEKAVHDAIDACRRAEVPLIIGGAVFAWPEHERYFDEQVLPRLDRWRRWIGPVAGLRKRRLLAAADCVLIPSRVDETSSLVAMEALAAGTPVIAYASGALPEIIENGRTGYIVDDVAGMAAAIARARSIDPAVCRRAARKRFPVELMTRAYLALYRRLASGKKRRIRRAPPDATSRAAAS